MGRGWVKSLESTAGLNRPLSHLDKKQGWRKNRQHQMAGTKGKSGGARPNTGGARANSGGARANSGGARPGAGRPPKSPEYLSLSTIYDDPANFLRAVMNDSGSEAKLRVDAAKALLRERLEAGKKEQTEAAAKKVAVGKFAASSPPLKLVNRK